MYFSLNEMCSNACLQIENQVAHWKMAQKLKHNLRIFK